MSQSRQFVTYLALILVSCLLWIALGLSGLLDGIEQEALRWRYLARGEVSSEAPIVFVNVDPRTVGMMGDKPWNRRNFAVTLANLFNPGKARAVGVDIIFSPMGAGSFSLLDVEKARKGDWEMGRVVEYYEDRLVLAAAYTGTSGDISGLPLRRFGYTDPAEVPFPEGPTFPIIKSTTARLGLVNEDVELNKGLIPLKVPAIIETSGEGFGLSLIEGQDRHYGDALKNPKLVKEEGFLRIVTEDGWPKLDAFPAQSTHRLLTLGLEVFLAAHGLNASDVEWTEEFLVIRRNGKIFREVPLIDGQTMEVNWLEGWDMDGPKHYSMADILLKENELRRAASLGDEQKIAELEGWFSRFEDKIVFIGATDATLKDLAPTPFNRAPVPKVGLHANVYRTLEESAYIHRLGPVASGVSVFALAALVAGLMAWSGAGRFYTRSASAGLLVGYGALVFYAFGAFGWVLPLIAPAGASVTAALCVLTFKLGSEEYQRRRIKNLFGSYVSPSLVEEMVESQRDPQLGGVEVQVTALFSDVEGFSALSEELNPHDLVMLMNEYLGAMTETFQEELGTLDKYIGDAIVTMFGMPYPVEDHAARACRSAIRMQERHAELRERWAREGKWPERVLKMRTRIGINTGEAVIGNMGSEMRFNYTMMGDSVNLAARCESGAKSYGVYTMITADTLETALQFGEPLNYRKLDRIIVKGRSQPVEVYELWDGTIDEDLMKHCKQSYEAALKDYFKGDWESALKGFETSALHEPARDYAPTTPSAVLAARCREFLEQGAPENWNGVYRMASK